MLWITERKREYYCKTNKRKQLNLDVKAGDSEQNVFWRVHGRKMKDLP
jgi:hypothetical protein